MCSRSAGEVCPAEPWVGYWADGVDEPIRIRPCDRCGRWAGHDRGCEPDEEVA